MLDTDTSSYVMKGHPSLPRIRLAQVDRDDVAISVIVQAELHYGLKPLPDNHPLHFKARQFLANTTVLAWDGNAADVFARIRYEVKTRGTPLPEMDLMIAAHAISLRAVLVTNNTRHFPRFSSELTLENWVTDSARSDRQ